MKNKYSEILLNILFPKRCAWCGNVIGFAASCACEKAVYSLKRSSYEIPLDGLNVNCLFLQAAYAPYSYKPPVSNAIKRLKFNADTSSVPIFANSMAQSLDNNNYDLIVPVPITPKTLKKRGFNQSYLLAQELAKQGIGELASEVIEKPFEIARQMDLSKNERQINIIGAFTAKDREKIKQKNILLVDDVITTGSTINECAKMLIGAGAASCHAVALAHTNKE